MEPTPKRTHRELMRPDLCPSLMMKQALTHAIDDLVWDQRKTPGDGYYWCLATCKDVGPDDRLVHPDSCGASRACWRGVQS